MIIALFIITPLVPLVYKILDYYKIIDSWTGRKAASNGLERLKNTQGYPINWIFDDVEDKAVFHALLKRIYKNTISAPTLAVIKEGIYHPTCIATAGGPVQIMGIPADWEQSQKYYYSPNHPILLMYGVTRQGGGNGKADRICSLGDLEKWLDDEKKKREFWIGTVTVSIMSIGLILWRLQWQGVI